MDSANLIVVGGPISVGKSTLVASLDFPQVPEINEDDKLQLLLLEETYKKGRVSAQVIELYFLVDRIAKYKKYSNTLTTHILDRSIFESLWFAKGNMTEKEYKLFYILWEKEVNKMINEFGKPKLYILLTMTWDTFKERIFTRGREVEVKNFSENEEFFNKHILEYEEHMTEVFNKFDINYVKVKTDGLTPEEVLKASNDAIKEVFNG